MTTQTLIDRLTQTNQFHENADVSTAEVVAKLEAQAREIERLQVEAEQLRNGHFDVSETASVLRAELAAIRAQAVGEPDGYVLVPVEPTDEMLEAWRGGNAPYGSYAFETYEDQQDWENFYNYRAMLSAARSQPVREPLTECRIELVTAIQTLASHYENKCYKFQDDKEVLADAQGDIDHARQIASKWNWNGITQGGKV